MTGGQKGTSQLISSPWDIKPYSIDGMQLYLGLISNDFVLVNEESFANIFLETRTSLIG